MNSNNKDKSSFKLVKAVLGVLEVLDAFQIRFGDRFIIDYDKLVIIQKIIKNLEFKVLRLHPYRKKR